MRRLRRGRSPAHVAVARGARYHRCGSSTRQSGPPAGLVGGGPGQLRRHQVNGETVHPKGQYQLSPGDRITLVEAGGGGFGKPAERSRALIRHDIAEGYVTPAGAVRDYGFDGE